MTSADSASAGSGQLMADIVVVGGGIAGCWTALKAIRLGLTVLLVEKDRIGAGASGGFLGALMPHMPERWDDKKDFQFRALIDLEHEVARIESETGSSAHYARVGRLAPLDHARQRANAERHAVSAKTVWEGKFAHSLRKSDCAPSWLAEDAAMEGAVFDDLSARLSPSHLLAAISRALEAAPGFRFFRGEVVAEAINPKSGALRLRDGTAVSFSHLVLANGIQAFELIAALEKFDDVPLGDAVKGQAALFNGVTLPDAPENLPLIFKSGVYIIAHGDGTVAIGSTSETEFASPDQTDEKLDEIIFAARALCPPLRAIEPVRRWASLRPRAIGRDPMIGRLVSHPNVFAAAGGYKITFGIAHRIADCLMAEIGFSSEPKVPHSFSLATHLDKARTRQSRDG